MVLIKFWKNGEKIAPVNSNIAYMRIYGHKSNPWILLEMFTKGG